MSGKIIEIYFTPESEGKMQAIDQVEVVADKGMIGDRYFGASADETIALIEVEQIEHFNREHGTEFANGVFRRGIVTQGIDLNELVGQTFMVGDLRVYGAELCEPCAYLASITTAAVLPDLVHHGGLRGRILDSGILSVGNEIKAQIATKAAA